jgi:hypothetical protein
MTNRYDVGQSVLMSATVRDPAGALADATVACKVKDPEGIVTTPAVAHGTTGLYSSVVVGNKEGTWHFRFEATGAVTASKEDIFVVKDSAFY